MKKLAHILAAALLLLLASSCLKDSRYIDPMLGDSTVRLEQKGQTIMRYNPVVCQLSFCRSRSMFRLQSDNTSDFFSLTLDRIPTEPGQQVSGTLVWTTNESIYTRKNVSFTLEKQQGDILWLWTGNGQMGAVVRLLD